jgi:hypothetical protein
MRWILWIACAAVAVAMMHSAGALATDAFPSAVAPYRLRPDPEATTPLEQEKLQLYKSQLQERVFDFERQQPRLDILEDEELRRARREIELMNRIIQGAER